KALYLDLKLRDPRTFIQSGNVVFHAPDTDLPRLARRIEDRIESEFGFRSEVILRTCAEMRDAMANNPFAGRDGIDPAKLLVQFLKDTPQADRCAKVASMATAPEELFVRGREVFIYFANGMARPKLSWLTVEKALGMAGTGRNWNSVGKLMAMAEAME